MTRKSYSRAICWPLQIWSCSESAPRMPPRGRKAPISVRAWLPRQPPEIEPPPGTFLEAVERDVVGRHQVAHRGHGAVEEGDHVGEHLLDHGKYRRDGREGDLAGQFQERLPERPLEVDVVDVGG